MPKIGFYAHTALDRLDGTALQLVIGGSWIYSGFTALDFGIAEDLTAGSAQEIAICFDLCKRHLEQNAVRMGVSVVRRAPRHYNRDARNNSLVILPLAWGGEGS